MVVTQEKEKVYEDKSTRGFFGIALMGTKFENNVGIVLRTAQIFGAAFVATIQTRYSRQRTDTGDSGRHLPVFHYDTFEDFFKHIPGRTDLVGVELDNAAHCISNFCYPPRSLFLFGAEDYGIPKKYLDMCRFKIKLPGTISMNLSSAASIVMYDRWLKATKNAII